MYLQRINTFLLSSLTLIYLYNPQIQGADQRHSFGWIKKGIDLISTLININETYKKPFERPIDDVFKCIFAQGTEKNNQNLARTCKTFNNVRRNYTKGRADEYNKKFEGKTTIYLTDTDKEYAVDSIHIFPGGKRCKITTLIRGVRCGFLDTTLTVVDHCFIDLDTLLRSDFQDRSKTVENGSEPVEKPKHLIDPKRRYIIACQPQKDGTNALCFFLPSSGQGFKIRSTDPVFDGSSCSLSIDTTNTAKITKCTPDLYPHQASFTRLDENELAIATLHTKACTLAGHTLSYHALLSCSAHAEYKRACWLITPKPELQIPAIPLTVKPQVCEEQYLLKEDSLLQDKRAQTSLYTVLSEGIRKLPQDVNKNYYNTDKLIGFYVAAVLWFNDDEQLAEASLRCLLDNAIEEAKYQAKSFLARTTQNITTSTTKLFVAPQKTSTVSDETLDNFHNELRGTLRDMKERNEKSYDAYLDAVKKFITDNYKNV